MKNLDDLIAIAMRPCQFCKHVQKCFAKDVKHNCAVDYYMISLRLIREGKY